METITSLQNDKVKLTKGLQSRARTRRKERKIALEGRRLVQDAIEHGQTPLFVLYEPYSTESGLIAMLETRNVNLVPVSVQVMAHISETPQPQGVVGVFPLPTPQLPHNPSRVLILDNLRDPGNLGTILRTAGAAGVQVVVLSPGCADPYNPKSLRSGMGAHFRVPVIEATWEQIAGYCKSLNIYLASGNSGVGYDSVDWQADWALIIGNEAHGVGSDASQLAMSTIMIPMAGETESLNAAIAAGIILFEAARQRK